VLLCGFGVYNPVRNSWSDPNGSKVSPVLAPAHAPVVAEINGVTAERTGVVPTVNPVLV
jgi:hypothetical protein